jgi:hypothetical protein
VCDIGGGIPLDDNNERMCVEDLSFATALELRGPREGA